MIHETYIESSIHLELEAPTILAGNFQTQKTIEQESCQSLVFELSIT